MMGYDEGSWGSWGYLMVIMMVLVTVAVVALVVWGVRTSRPAVSGALEILEQRYARGEIDEDEFRGRRDLLRSAGPDAQPPGGA